MTYECSECNECVTEFTPHIEPCRIDFDGRPGNAPGHCPFAGSACEWQPVGEADEFDQRADIDYERERTKNDRVTLVGEADNG